MTTSLGLDHALVAVHDIDAARQCYMGLGFASRGFGQHPWGTSNAVFIFPDQLFEIVSIGDADLLDGYATNGFRFGRHVADHLARTEGVALTALNSQDAEADARELAARGVIVTGTIDFGRDVTRSDGTSDRTSTRLKVLFNDRFPRLSLFACQQFRRDLIEYPEWMDHPNGVTAIAGMTVLSPASDIADAADWLSKVHGVPAARDGSRITVPTAKGRWSIVDQTGFRDLHAGADPVVGPVVGPAEGPFVAGIDLVTAEAQQVATRATALGLATIWQDGVLILPEAERLGGICLRFGRFD